MPKGDVRRTATQETGKAAGEHPKPLSNRELHGGQGPHGGGEREQHHESEGGEHGQNRKYYEEVGHRKHNEGGGHEHDHNKGVEYEHEHNERGEHDRRENHPDADSHDSEHRKEGDVASLIKPSEDTRVSSLLTTDHPVGSESHD